MHEERVGLESDGDDEVIRWPPVPGRIDQQDDGLERRQVTLERFEITGRDIRAPAAAGELRGQPLRLDPAAAPIHQWRKWLHARMTVAPVAQHHGGGRATTERFRLRDERDRERRREASGSAVRGLDARNAARE